MEKVEGESFQRTEVTTDGNEYVGCEFDNCMMIYKGSGDCSFSKCSFKDCEWLFEGAIGRTIAFSG